MKKIPVLATLLIAAVSLAKANPVYFGTDGIVNDKNSALAVLVPYSAPHASIKLIREKVEYLGGGEYSITRILFNEGDETVGFNDILKVEDLFGATHYTIPCVSYNGNDFDGGATITGDGKYLERAEKAAAYFSNWMFFFDPLYGPETDFVKYNWHVTGGTAVSAEHQCIDAWGGIMPADLYELSALTGNPMWERIARLMWANAYRLWTLNRLHNRGITLK
ncbi:MAG: hypothetical protein II537_06395 [Bacteroidales bacterium]|nr:hypothetical protein [Bacteroidales bacterium]